MLASIDILIALIITAIVNIGLIIYLEKRKAKDQLGQMFLCTLILLFVWVTFLILQITLSKPLGIKPVYFEYVVYIGACFLPVTIFFIGLIYLKKGLKFKPIYLLTLVIPTVSLIGLWTNDFHHLFYKEYSVELALSKFGPLSNLHTVYSYLMLGFGLLFLLIATIKNSGLLSKQALFIFLGIAIPISISILGTFEIIHMSVYITPITFAFAIAMCAISIFKFQFLGVAPIALQIVVNRISDSYVVLGIYNNIIDFNETFIKTFGQTEKKLKSETFELLLNSTGSSDAETAKILNALQEVKTKNHRISFEHTFSKIGKIFQIEITPIISNNTILGTLFLFKDITEHKHDLQTIKDNQTLLIERERLASLGQLIGGIAHNLKTPIMSIAGADEGLSDLVKELDASIGNPVVNDDDFHAIAKDMNDWIEKIKSYTSYMSDILTAVKGQAVTFSEQENENFTVSELFKRVDILMKHELKQAVVYLNVSLKIPENTLIYGNVNSLVQVINNMISNSIQAYGGKPDQKIELIAEKDQDKHIIISVKDYGPGLPDVVKEKLFNEMVTTKGKDGTGLGLYMSYSTIKAHFNGDIKVESSKSGTTFNIILPLR